jgi:hypothetical protein
MNDANNTARRTVADLYRRCGHMIPADAVITGSEVRFRPFHGAVGMIQKEIALRGFSVNAYRGVEIAVYCSDY